MTPHVSLQRLEETCSWERRGVEREKDTKEEKETIISKHLSRILEKNNSLCWLKVVEVYSAALLWTTYRLKCFSESSSHILHCNLAWKRAVGEFPSQLKDKLPTLGSKLWMDPESQACYELNMIAMGLLQCFGWGASDLQHVFAPAFFIWTSQRVWTSGAPRVDLFQVISVMSSD